MLVPAVTLALLAGVFACGAGYGVYREQVTTARVSASTAATMQALVRSTVNAADATTRAQRAESELVFVRSELATAQATIEAMADELTAGGGEVAIKSSGEVSRGTSRTYEVTAYCSCALCCGKSNGITASGTQAHWGTVAASLPFGTKLRIEGFDTVFTVEDRGGAIGSGRVDIWFPTHAEALAFGRRELVVEVLK